jgi:transcriptional regulator with XRE-family HTH domain
MLDQRFPNRLRYLRVRQRLSQKQIASLLGGHDRSLVSRYERGNLTPSFPVAAKLQILFGVALSDIFPALFSQMRQEIDAARSHIPPVAISKLRP